MLLNIFGFQPEERSAKGPVSLKKQLVVQSGYQLNYPMFYHVKYRSDENDPAN